MKIRNFLVLITLLLIATLSMISYFPVKTAILANPSELPTRYPVVYVYPETLNVDVNTTFTVSMIAYNLTDATVQDPENPIQYIPLGNLYGFDIQITWDPTIIKYVNHTLTVAVEDYPTPVSPSPYAGILHSPKIDIVNNVNESGNMEGAVDPSVRAWFAVASIAPAMPFNGNGTIFTMTFQALKKGVSPIEIVSCTLADKDGKPIGKHVCSQFSGQWLNSPRDGEVIVGTAPRVSFTFSPDIGVVNRPVNFTATVSENASNIQAYVWNFGDGRTENTTSPTVQHTYTDVSLEYTVSLKVVDLEGVESKLVTRKITVVHSRDLKASSLSISHVAIKPNNTFTLTAKIENKGNATFEFDENCTLKIYYNTTAINPEDPADWDLSKWTIARLTYVLVKFVYPPPMYPLPTEVTLSFNSTETFGEFTQDTYYYFQMRATGIPSGYETNPDDNIAISSVLLYTIQTTYTPKIESFQFGYLYQKIFKTPLIDGENATFKYTIKNAGTEPADYNVTIYLNGTVLVTHQISDLNPAATQTRQFTSKALAGGNYNVTLEAIAEDYSADILQSWLRVVKPPILTITMTPTNPAIGQNVTFDSSASVHQEPGASFKTYTWKIYDPDGNLFSLGSDVSITLALNKTGEWTVELYVEDNFGLKYDSQRSATKAYRLIEKVNIGGAGFPFEWVIAVVLIVVVVAVAVMLIVRRRQKAAIPTREEEEE